MLCVSAISPFTEMVSVLFHHSDVQLDLTIDVFILSQMVNTRKMWLLLSRLI